MLTRRTKPLLEPPDPLELPELPEPPRVYFEALAGLRSRAGRHRDAPEGGDTLAKGDVFEAWGSGQEAS